MKHDQIMAWMANGRKIAAVLFMWQYFLVNNNLIKYKKYDVIGMLSYSDDTRNK